MARGLRAPFATVTSYSSAMSHRNYVTSYGLHHEKIKRPKLCRAQIDYSGLHLCLSPVGCPSSSRHEYTHLPHTLVRCPRLSTNYAAHCTRCRTSAKSLDFCRFAFSKEKVSRALNDFVAFFSFAQVPVIMLPSINALFFFSQLSFW